MCGEVSTNNSVDVIDNEIGITTSKGKKLCVKLEDVNLSKHTFIAIKPEPGVPKYKPVVDVSSPSFAPNDTLFKLFKNDTRGVKKEVPPTPDVLVASFFSTKHVNYLVHCSNTYVDLWGNAFFLTCPHGNIKGQVHISPHHECIILLQFFLGIRH